MVVDADLMVQYKINGRGSDDWRTGRLDDGRGSRQIARGLRGFGGQPSHRGSDGRGAMTTELRDAAAEVHRSAAEVWQPKVRRSGSLRALALSLRTKTWVRARCVRLVNRECKIRDNAGTE